MSKNVSGRPVSLPQISGESPDGEVKPYALTGHIHERITCPGDGESTIKIAFIENHGWVVGGFQTSVEGDRALIVMVIEGLIYHDRAGLII